MKFTLKDAKKGLCAPSVISALLGVSAIVSNAMSAKGRSQLGETVLAVVIQFLIIYTLCYYGHHKVAWAFLLLPLLILVPIILLAAGIVIGGSKK